MPRASSCEAAFHPSPVQAGIDYEYQGLESRLPRAAVKTTFED